MADGFRLPAPRQCQGFRTFLNGRVSPFFPGRFSLLLFLFLFLLQFSYYIRHHVRFAKRVIVQDLHAILF